MKSQQSDVDLVHDVGASLSTSIRDEIANESGLSSLAYANLAVFIAVLFCFSGLDPVAATSYVLLAFLFFIITAVVGYFARKSSGRRFGFVTVLGIVFVNETALVSILAFDAIAENRANSLTAVAIVVSACFISVPLCARHTAPMFLSKFCAVTACVVFLIARSNVPLLNNEIVASLMVALLIMLSIGYWIVIRRREEIQLQLRLRQMKKIADEQNDRLLLALEEKENSQQLLMEESQLRQKLITHIGHDLRQPITAAVYMLMEMKKNNNGAEQETLIEDTTECVESAGRLIENIVQFSQFDNLSIDVRLQHINLNVLLQSIYREYSGSAQQAQCTMRCVETSIVIQQDWDLLIRILRNLTINVIKHSDATKMLLGVRRVSGAVEIWVADNGCGLGTDENKSVSSQSRSKQTGLGLGMKISEQLAQACGASLEFHTKQGEGTVCKLNIPEKFVLSFGNSRIEPDNKQIQEFTQTGLTSEDQPPATNVNQISECSGKVG